MDNNDLMVTLSFSSYSTNGLASIAVKVTDESNNTLEGLFDEDEFEFSLDHLQAESVIYDRNIFNRGKIEGNDDFSIKMPLKQLFAYDSEDYSLSSTSSSSSSLSSSESVRPAWKKSSSFADGGRRKSRGWNMICDLLRRSSSDSKVGRKSGAEKMKAASLATAMEVYYVRSKAEQGGGKRKSYLPYRQQLVGFFGRKY